LYGTAVYLLFAAEGHFGSALFHYGFWVLVALGTVSATLGNVMKAFPVHPMTDTDAAPEGRP
jgi:hypothetical protein